MRKKTQYIVVNEIYKTIYCGYPQKRAWKNLTTAEGGALTWNMEAGNRCKDECLPEETNRRIVDIISDVNLAYSEHARKYLHECGLPKERVYVTGSPIGVERT